MHYAPCYRGTAVSVLAILLVLLFHLEKTVLKELQNIKYLGGIMVGFSQFFFFIFF